MSLHWIRFHPNTAQMRIPDHSGTGLLNSVLKGHDFSRAEEVPKITGLSPLWDVFDAQEHR
jgi:hypothetical protein